MTNKAVEYADTVLDNMLRGVEKGETRWQMYCRTEASLEDLVWQLLHLRCVAFNDFEDQADISLIFQNKMVKFRFKQFPKIGNIGIYDYLKRENRLEEIGLVMKKMVEHFRKE
jgi:hypothetical protein